MLSTPDINKLSVTRKDTKNPKFKRDTLEPTLEEKLEQLEQLDQNNSSKALHLVRSFFIYFYFNILFYLFIILFIFNLL